MLSDLLAEEGVDEICELAGAIGVMALHGGLEAQTLEAARYCAAAVGGSLYAVVQPDDLRWHVPSLEFDPRMSARLEAFVAHVAVAISFHGFGDIARRRGEVLVGGGNRVLAGAIGAAIEESGLAFAVTDLDEMPRRLRGVHPRNPVNLPRLGGVQLELSVSARSDGLEIGIADAVASALASHLGSLLG